MFRNMQSKKRRKYWVGLLVDKVLKNFKKFIIWI